MLAPWSRTYRLQNCEQYTRRSVQKVSSYVVWKIEVLIEEDTRYKKHCTKDSDSSVPFKVSTLGLHTVFCQSPPAAPLYFPEFHWWSEIFSFLKVILILRKARSCRAPNLDCTGAESPVWFDVFPKICTRQAAWAGTLLWRSCQSPVAHSCSLLNHANSFHGGMFKLNTKFDADLLLYSVILNAMATQYTCSLSGICCLL